MSGWTWFAVIPQDDAEKKAHYLDVIKDVLKTERRKENEGNRI